MSTWQEWVIALLAVWSATLTFAIVLLFRQVALLSVRTVLAGIRHGASVSGPEPGMAIAADLIDRFGIPAAGPAYVLGLAVNCNSCREIAAELDKVPSDDALIVAVTGDAESWDRFRSLLPDDVRVVAEPEASELLDRLSIRGRPLVVSINAGVIVSTGYIRTIEDLTTFIRAATGEYVTDEEVAHVS